MDRIKLFALKTDNKNFEFINYIIPKGALVDDNVLLDTLFKKLCKILLPYLDVLTEEYVMVSYLNTISRDLELDVDQEVNKKLSDEEKEEINKIISVIFKVFMEALS